MTTTQLPKTLDEARPVLGARLYGAIGHALRAKELVAAGAADALPAVEPVAGEVLVGAVVDFDSGVVPLSESLIADAWGVTPREVIALAGEGGRDRAVEMARLGEGTFVIDDEQLGVAFLLDPAKLSGLPVQGSPVVLVPGAGIVIVTGSRDAEGLTTAVTAAEHVAADGEALVSAVPLVRDGDAWSVFEWPADEELRIAVARLQRVFAQHWYAAQARQLTERPEFVADAQLYEKDGLPVLVGTWTRGVETLLPVVDQVLVVDERGAVSAEPFRDFVQRPGVTATELDPPRYRVAADAT